jgi:hypothetical protein
MKRNLQKIVTKSAKKESVSTASVSNGTLKQRSITTTRSRPESSLSNYNWKLS